MRVNQNRQSGMAMVLVITILAALLAIGAVALTLQLNSTKSAGLLKERRTALYCAEAGLAQARNVLIANRRDWGAILAGNTADLTYYPIVGDFDADGANDYQVTIRDDGDDADSTTDNNDTIIVISTCTKFSDAPSTVMEIIALEGRADDYTMQQGGGQGNLNNQNGQ